jgi:hypothetical protein
VTEAEESPTKRRVARAAAEYVSGLGHWPGSATAIRKLGGKDRSRKLGDEERFLWNHLKGIEATYRQEANRGAGSVGAGTEAKSVPGTNEEGKTMWAHSSGL